MDKYCSTCGSELVVTDITAYCPFCTIIKKRPMKTFFIHWKNGLGERLQGTSITNALVIARYDAAAIGTLDYYTVDDDPIKMRIITPRLSKERMVRMHIIIYKEVTGHSLLIEGFDVKHVAEREKNKYIKNANSATLGSSYSIKQVTCWICDKE